MVIESHLLSQIGQSHCTSEHFQCVRRLNRFWPSAFSDASLKVKECASEWEQEVQKLGARAGYLLWLDQVLS